MNGIEQVIDSGFCFTKQLLIERHVHVVALLQVHQHGHDGFDSFVVHDHFHGFADNQILNPILLDGLFVTFRALFLDGHAFVVVVNHARAAGAAFAAEIRAAISAEQLCC